MASGKASGKASGENGVTGDARYLSPLAAVEGFFDSLAELRAVSGRGGTEEVNQRLLVACEDVSSSGERVVKCLEHRIRQENRASELSHEVLGAFQLGLRRLMQLKGEVKDLKKVVGELNLADQGLDSRTIGTLPSSMTSTSSSLTSSTSFHSLQEKQRNQRDFVVPGTTSDPIPRASSYEDFLKHKDLALGSSKRSEFSAVGGSRKAKSEPDLAAHTLRKKIDTLTIDNDRLKTSEKTLIKKTIKLSRNCKALEKERDVAEDRLKIEQTQRDSIEKLRQRNKELEEQLRELCDNQVIREREAAKAGEGEGADPPPPTSPPQPQEQTPA